MEKLEGTKADTWRTHNAEQMQTRETSNVAAPTASVNPGGGKF